MDDFLISVREIVGDAFGSGIGTTSYLKVPADQAPAPAHAMGSSAAWFAEVEKAALWTNSAGESRGDILFVVHGYNMSEAEVIDRHRLIKDDLAAEGFKGAVVSFDWPCDNKTLAYLPDRHEAKITAMRLVSDGIEYLSATTKSTCVISVHVLGHSTGAYVIREAFDDADDSSLPNGSWNVSQLIFIAGDVSSASMSALDCGAESIYRHCIRMTNYSNRHDQALDLSNVKRLGIAPRVGRIGLPPDSPSNAVNVDCTNYYEQLDQPGFVADNPEGFRGLKSHSWYFGNKMFAKDLFFTLIGTDRTVMPTRSVGLSGEVSLKHI